MNLPDGRKKMIAFQASKGTVSGYIQRYINALPNSSWEDLKGELAKRFFRCDRSTIRLRHVATN